MIRLTYILRRIPRLSLHEFQRYWLETHGPLVSEHASALGVRRYVQVHTLGEDPLNPALCELYGTSPDIYDGVAELWWKDLEDLKGAIVSPEGQRAAQELLEDERKFIDFSRSTLWFAIELPQINPSPETIVAREEGPLVKIVFPLWRHPHLSLEATQLHWRMNHGPLARQYGAAVRFRRYLQVHAVEAPLAEALRAARGAMEEPGFGHAEVWIDRQEFAMVSGPEVDEAFPLFVEDCRYFIDLSRSPMWAGKEHVIVDRKRIVAPLPKPKEIVKEKKGGRLEGDRP